MKGRFESSQNQVRAMAEQITLLQSASPPTTSAPATPTPPELRAASLLTPAEVSEFGEEFLGVVAKKAREEVSPELAALRQELAGLRSKVDGVSMTTHVSAQSRMHVTLDEQCSNWREINVDQNFHDWLALPDAYSGAIRHELLKAAYERNDSPRVLAFFKGFLAEEAAVAPATVEPDPGPAPTKIPLADLAAPGRAKTAAASPNAPAEKPTFTRAQISKFYSDSAAGKYRGREAEKTRIEETIFAAEREGRISG
jgi:hypothetical protein